MHVYMHGIIPKSIVQPVLSYGYIVWVHVLPLQYYNTVKTNLSVMKKCSQCACVYVCAGVHACTCVCMCLCVQA